MTVKQYRNSNKIIFFILAVSVIYSVWSGYTYIAFLEVGLYMGVISLLKTRVDGILADERQLQVAEKASRTSFNIMMPMLLLTSLALMSSAGREEWHYLKALGIIMSYVTALGVLIYLLTYWYFDKKTGGR